MELTLAWIRQTRQYAKHPGHGLNALETIAVLDALEKALQKPKLTGWLPIATAPKDGTRIILGYTGCDVFTGFWTDGFENYWKRSGWYDAEDSGNILTAKTCAATHWQPLPDPPRDPQTTPEGSLGTPGVARK